MDRRAFLMASAVTPLLGAVVAGQSGPYGRLDVPTALALGYLPARVLLDGQEIHDCTVLDDSEGWVEVFKRNADGHYYLNETKDAAVTERLYGHVRYVPNPHGVRGEFGPPL
jgi:hypothetical protein